MIKNVFFIITILIFSLGAAAENGIKIISVPQPEILPYKYVVGAGELARKLYKNQIEQEYFIRSYADAISDYAVFGVDKFDVEESKAGCADDKDNKYLVIQMCALYEAAKLFKGDTADIDLIPFGYQEHELVGKIDKDKKSGRFFYVASDGATWEVVFRSKIRGDTERLHGYLSLEGDYSRREDGKKVDRYFVVTD